MRGSSLYIKSPSLKPRLANRACPFSGVGCMATSTSCAPSAASSSIRRTANCAHIGCCNNSFAVACSEFVLEGLEQGGGEDLLEDERQLRGVHANEAVAQRHALGEALCFPFARDEDGVCVHPVVRQELTASAASDASTHLGSESNTAASDRSDMP